MCWYFHGHEKTSCTSNYYSWMILETKMSNLGCLTAFTPIYIT